VYQPFRAQNCKTSCTFFCSRWILIGAVAASGKGTVDRQIWFAFLFRNEKQWPKTAVKSMRAPGPLPLLPGFQAEDVGATRKRRNGGGDLSFTDGRRVVGVLRSNPGETLTVGR
jgi:hypothetical protein